MEPLVDRVGGIGVVAREVVQLGGGQRLEGGDGDSGGRYLFVDPAGAEAEGGGGQVGLRLRVGKSRG